jgi:membrane protein implicated in regulation of membrane protease activity
MTFEGYLIAIAFILIAVDIFVASDIPTHISYILFTYVLSKGLPIHFMYRILAGIVFWFLLIGFHYFIWKKLVTVFVNKFVAPEKKAAGIDALKGENGEIKEIEGKKLVKVNEELFPYQCDVELQPGSRIKVVGNKDGVLKIVGIHNNSNP